MRVVARRGPTDIAQTRHGLVLAAAGVDASNVRPDEVALLPLDPDASRPRPAGPAAGAHRPHRRRSSSATPWAAPGGSGQVDQAIGVAGLAPVRDSRGLPDSHGKVLEVTEIAVADELASAAELVKGKSDGVPVALVRGLALPDDGRGAAALVRPAGAGLVPAGHPGGAGRHAGAAPDGARRSPTPRSTGPRCSARSRPR